MKSTMIYTCDICGNTSPNKDTISCCEKSHIKVEGIHKVTYERSDIKNKYPMSIHVTMENGQSIRYTRA